MPLYNYRCSECNALNEGFNRIAERHTAPPCPGCDSVQTLAISTPRIVSDIEPYRAVADDVATGSAPVITSRSQHREFLRRNGLSEIGNDVSYLKPREIPLSDPSAEVRRAYDKVIGA